jgi:cytochrome c-type biogenesis protein CcmH/NrfF
MRILWFIPVTLFALGAGAFLRHRWRSSREVALSSEPVSGEWLAQARSREEHRW